MPAVLEGKHPLEKMSGFRYVPTENQRVFVYGKTFDVKERLKEVGGRWDPNSTAWTIPAASDTPEFRANLAALFAEQFAKKKAKAAKEKEERLAAIAYAMTPEGIAEAKERNKNIVLACLEQKKKTGAYHWICCENVEVLDWNRQYTSCKACGSDYGTHIESFFVRGRLRTGD